MCRELKCFPLHIGRGEDGLRSMSTSWMAPVKHRTTFTSSYGARWKCMPRTVPVSSVCEKLCWTVLGRQPSLGEFFAHREEGARESRGRFVPGGIQLDQYHVAFCRRVVLNRINPS